MTIYTKFGTPVQVTGFEVIEGVEHLVVDLPEGGWRKWQVGEFKADGGWQEIEAAIEVVRRESEAETPVEPPAAETTVEETQLQRFVDECRRLYKQLTATEDDPLALWSLQNYEAMECFQGDPESTLPMQTQRTLALDRIDLATATAFRDRAAKRLKYLKELVAIALAPFSLEVDALNRDVIAIEEQASIHAVTAYALCDRKTLPSGFGIQERKKVHYDPAEAETWVRQNAPNLLTLDVKRFEAAVKAGTLKDCPAEVLALPTATLPRTYPDMPLPEGATDVI